MGAGGRVGFIDIAHRPIRGSARDPEHDDDVLAMMLSL